MAFVPEGQADSSQARSAWVTMQSDPRPGGTVEVLSVPGERAKGVGHGRIIFWHFACLKSFCDVSISRPRSVQSSRWDEAIFLVTPGTSCLATISLSLRDKIHSPAEAKLKLALMRLKPRVETRAESP